jgi:choline dehydrogenase-like flavoprotein
MRFNFYSDGTVTDAESDAQKMVAFAKIIRATMFDNFGATMIYPTEAAFNDGDQAIFDQLFDAPIIFTHATGTCQMGTSAANGVVDGSLHVFGTQNLMVADISISPRPVDGNTAYSAYLIGMIAARECGSQTVPALP